MAMVVNRVVPNFFNPFRDLTLIDTADEFS